MTDEPCENKYCLMDRRDFEHRRHILEFENKQLRRMLEILTEPYAYHEEMSLEDALRASRENQDARSKK